jgi:hypothetical protein
MKRILVALLVTAACSDTPTEPLDPVVGHFIGPAWVAVEPEGYYLAISLRKSSATELTGEGWLSGISYPAIPFRVAGTYDVLNVDLTLNHTDGSPFATLTGTVSQSRMSGEWTREGTSLPLELARVDTNATATYQATLGGAFAETHQGSAGFTFQRAINRTGLVLGWFETSDPLFVVSWAGAPKGPGAYNLAPTASMGASVHPTGEPGYRYTVIGGTLNIDVSTEYAMIGRVSVQATEDVGTRVVTLQGQFSAGCAGPPCRP